MAMTHIDFPLEDEIKTKAEKTSALLGMNNLAEYVVWLIERDATNVTGEHENITVKDDLFDRFMKACKKVLNPNSALHGAAALTKERDIR